MSRLWLLVVILFWVVMNGLLWRAEYGSSATLGSKLPVAVVWKKILDTPDASGLEIRQNGEKIGYFRWSVLQETPEDAESVLTENPGQEELDGMIERILGYSIQVDGSFSPNADPQQYVRYGFSIRLAPDGTTWTNANFRVGMKRTWLELGAEPGAEEVTLKHTQGSVQSDFRLAWADLRNPGRLLQSLGVPLPWESLLPLTGLPAMPTENMELGLSWEAGSEFVTVAHTRVRVYYLRTRLLEDMGIRLMISRAGEILRAELPYGITLVNESFTGL